MNYQIDTLPYMKKIKEVFPDKKKAVLIMFDQNSPYLYLLPAGN